VALGVVLAVTLAEGVGVPEEEMDVPGDSDADGVAVPLLVGVVLGVGVMDGEGGNSATV
jgi:hypothetical protein